MTLDELNRLSFHERYEKLFNCCGSSAWVAQMSSLFPFGDKDTLFKKADEVWHSLGEQDWREAFGHHPRIGDIDSLKKKFAATADWAAGEQASVQQASQEILQALAEGNRAYEGKFGYIFIVCATGKSAEEMLHLLRCRLSNQADKEIRIAALEQARITKIRLEKLLR